MQNSEWNSVLEFIKKPKQIQLGKYASYWAFNTPRRMLFSMAYYKFAARLIGTNKRVLDVGCNEGLGSMLLSKMCGYCLGIDFDKEAITMAQSNFCNESIAFEHKDFLKRSGEGNWDAAVSLDVIEHLQKEEVKTYLSKIREHLKPHGSVFIGTPSLASQQYASKVTKEGHINVYTPERLESELRQHFDIVFMFSAHDEVIHTGFFPMAQYLMAIACKPK